MVATASSIACDICGATFASRNLCFAHLRAKHAMQIEAPQSAQAHRRTAKVAVGPQRVSGAKKAKRVFTEPYVVCPSGCWYMPAPLAPPAAKYPLIGELRWAWIEPDTRRMSHLSSSHISLSAVARGVLRRAVLCADSVAWLRDQPGLPDRCHVITSLPDIAETKLSAADYEAWFSSVVELILSKLCESSVAIFYQTDGRHSGPDGSWLDKGFLCTVGARAAGARMVWHRIVNASRPAQLRSGRPGYARLICFSRAHRCSVEAGVDVLPQRGHMSYKGAAGEAACSAAVQYVVRAHASRSGRRTEGDVDEGESEHVAPAERMHLDLPEAHRDAPALILDPFCGHGTVLALANAWGLDAMGLDTHRKRCELASERRPLPEEHVFDDSGVQMGTVQYWA